MSSTAATRPDELDDAQARLNQLMDELADIDERRAAIRGQIEKAQAEHRTNGGYADADWFRRAKGALRHLGVERAEVCREIGEANRRIRAMRNATSTQAFYLAVRDVVDDVTWARIVERHEARLREGGGA